MSQRTVAPPEVFVKTWQSCNSVGEVASELGISKAAVASRYRNFKKRGVNLKAMSRTKFEKLDIDKLNKLCNGGY